MDILSSKSSQKRSQNSFAERDPGNLDSPGQDNRTRLDDSFRFKTQNKVIYRWEAEEFSYYEKSRLWFVIGGIIFFIMVGYFIISKQIIATITFLLLGITIYLFSLKKPRVIKCSIGYKGISVDDVTYAYKELDSFWIFFEPPDFKVISLKPKKPYLPHIQIPFDAEDPMEIRKTLIQFLPEEEQEEAFSDKMARYLRF